MPKIKVLFVTSKLQHYRVPILNLIASSENIDLTVSYTTKSFDSDNFLFKEKINSEKKIGPFTIHQKGFITYCKSFDVVVSMFYLQKISLMLLMFFKKRYKLIYWGIGVKASQKSKFDSPTHLNKIRYAIARISDAMIFYTNYALEKYVDNNIKKEKLFVMQNTVSVIDNRKTLDYSSKNKLLFIGAFNASKNIFELLTAYKNAFNINPKISDLLLVGEGPEYIKVQEWIEKEKLDEKINLLGPIYEEEAKASIFNDVIACISPGQAGLSVLTSFGYGVPFITQEDANTGGERLNIENDITGKLYKDKDELQKIILEITSNTNKYLEMGQKAQTHYYKNRTPEIMANGFIEAVSYVKTK